MKLKSLLQYPIGKLLVLCIFISLSACTKSFLDKKPNSNIIQPNTINDLQGLLDYFERLNSDYPSLPQLSCDDYYFVSKTYWESTRSAVERNSYIWDKDVYGGEAGILSWNGPYTTIFYANNVIESAEKIRSTSDNQNQLSDIKGQAHFFRAYAYYELLKNFSKVYDEGTATSDPGVPLRLSPGIDEILPRESVQRCYEQVISDLNIAKELMTLTQPNPSRNRPSRLAAYALFSRIYLSMRKYDLSYSYSDSTLKFYSTLIDYNTVSASSTTPFSINNEETLFSTRLSAYNTLNYRNSSGSTNIDTTLIASYSANDLRRTTYFETITPGLLSVRRGYFGSGLSPYNGLASDEMYLIKAECAARLNKTEEAMSILNELLAKRYKTGTFVPLTASSPTEALQIILTERRKELVWRGLRWDDLKRLNKEGANISLSRNLDGQTYTLPADDPRWVFNIPQDEINYSGIAQNPR